MIDSRGADRPQSATKITANNKKPMTAYLTPEEQSRLERDDLVQRFERAAQRVSALASVSTSASDAEPDVAFLLHAIELLFLHGLRPSLLQSLVGSAATPWAVLQDAALFDAKRFRSLVDAAKRRGRNNLARGRIAMRAALNQGDAIVRLARIVSESALSSANYEPTAALRQASDLQRILEHLVVITSGVAFRVDEVPARIDQADFWTLYLDELDSARQLVAVRTERAEALLRGADQSVSAPASPPPPAEAIVDGIDKSLVFRSSTSDQRKVRASSSRKPSARVAAFADDADAPLSLPSSTVTTPRAPPPIEPAEQPPSPPPPPVAAAVVEEEPPQELPALSVAEFYKPSEAEQRRTEEAELDAILTLAVNRSFGADTTPSTSVREEPAPPPRSPSPVPSLSPSPPRTPKASNPMTDSYKYAYVSSALLGATPPAARTPIESPAAAPVSPAPAATVVVVREAEAPTSSSALQISIVDDYEPQRRERALTDSRVPAEARGSRLFLERRHRPPDNMRNEACHGCQKALRFSRLGDEARYCFFFGRYFCSECHLNEWRSIPARAVLEGDWKLRKVSTAAASHIDRLWQSRQIDCALAPEALYRALPTYLVLRQRVARAYVAALHVCPARDALLASDDGRLPPDLLLALDDALDEIRHDELYRATVVAREAAIRAQPGVLDHAGLHRAPLIELLRRFCDEPLGGCVYVSLAELSELRSKAPAAVARLAMVAAAFEQHVSKECTRCLLLGSACPKCERGNLFDWSDASERCGICLLLYHRGCLADSATSTCAACAPTRQKVKP